MRLTTSRDRGPNYAQQKAASWSIAASGAVVAVLGLVFALDRSTGSAPVQHLYYLPIIFAAVRFESLGGLATSFAAIVLYHAANPRLLAFEHQHWDIVQVALFVVVGLITAKLTDDARRLHVLATTDDLTGLHNLRSFETNLAAMVRGCREAQVPVAMLSLDVDHLKSLNDAHGHLAGAEAVRVIGHIIGSHVPTDAVACRYGGDEFVIAIPRCTVAGARTVADDVRQLVQTTAPVLSGVPFPAGTLSVSIGVACRSFAGDALSSGDAEWAEELFRAADRALYEAKENGRNHVCVAQDLHSVATAVP